MAAKTISRNLCSVRAFARWAKIKTDLDEYRPPQALKSDPHPLPEGIRAVYRMANLAETAELRAMVVLCGLLGLRISEALSIRASSFNTDDPENIHLIVRGKGDKMRRVPVSDKTWRFLLFAWSRSKLNGNAPLCGNYGDRTARKMITDLGERIHVSRRVASHDLRATFATEVYNRTHNLRVVQELLGHSSVAITEAYLGVNSSQLREAVTNI